MDEEKQIPESTTAPEKPKRKRQSTRRPAGKKSKVVEDFLKKQPASTSSAPIEQLKETQKYEPVNSASETPLEVQDEEEVVDKMEPISDAYAGGKISTRQKKLIKVSLIVLISLLFLGLLGSAGYFYFQYKNVSKVNTAENEIKNYTVKIGKFILLPDEEPTLATVADKEKLQGQPFFANAQNGDKVLLFSKAQKAILYRPSESKIIEVMATGSAAALQPSENGESENNYAVDTNNGQAQANPTESGQSQPEPAAPDESQSAESQLPAARVAVYNGARVSGLAQKIADLVALMPDITVAEKTNAEGKYKKTLVIDLSGSRGELAQKIAEILGGEAGTMPEGEVKPNADILIIGGSDFKTN